MIPVTRRVRPYHFSVRGTPVLYWHVDVLASSAHKHKHKGCVRQVEREVICIGTKGRTGEICAVVAAVLGGGIGGREGEGKKRR